MFIKVTARVCMNVAGNFEINERVPTKTMLLNTDVIGAIEGNIILLKGGDILRLGEHYYKDFRLVGDAKSLEVQ